MRPSKPNHVPSTAIVAVAALVAVAGVLAGCVAGDAPRATSAQASAVGSAAVTAASAAASTTPHPGLGVDRATLRSVIDAASAPETIEWQEGHLAKDGTPKLEGTSFQSLLSVLLLGQPDDVALVQVFGSPVSTPDEAPVALAAVHSAAPELEAWWRSTFDGSGDAQRHDDAGLTMFWGRDALWLDGAHVSMLLIAPTDLAPKPTPAPTPRTTPAPTPLPDLAAYFPATIDERPAAVSHWTGANMPDDASCLPLCRWQVAGYADALGIRPEVVEVAMSEVGSTGPIQVAVLRVPHPDGMPFVTAYWEEALRTKWPDVLRSGHDYGPGRNFEIFREHQTGEDERAPAWYVRWLGDVLVIVSDEVAQSWLYEPRKSVSRLLEALPTPQ